MSLSVPPVPFWFLRHGETDYNAKGLSQGGIDVPLNETGRAQARAAGPLLKDAGITTIFASPMLRTRETAEIVNETLQQPMIFEPDLREVVFGGMEGKPLMPWYTSWIEGRYLPEGAESFAEVITRAQGAFARVLQHPGPILIVSHGGVARALHVLMGTASGEMTPNGMPFLCKPTAIAL